MVLLRTVSIYSVFTVLRAVGADREDMLTPYQRYSIMQQSLHDACCSSKRLTDA